MITATMLAGPSIVNTARAEDSVLVYAAASLADVMTVIAEDYTGRTATRISLSFAASSSLARQIENGAPADVFVSANQLWMDRLDSAGLVLGETRSDVAGNRLALIAPSDSSLSATPDHSLDLATLLEDGWLAMGDPDHVPAGLYGQAALEFLGLWPHAEHRLARTGDVRGAVALVARGETPLGIVYATDAALSDQVRLVGLFPADSHPPILYPAAVTRTANAEASRFLAFLSGAEAQAIFRERGFSTPDGDRLDPAS